ncbi:MAG: RNA-binding S4 domain-containing protein [Saprospirales bacterium]|jgi:ribosome-associated heat shock protein Hsp15|nr:RNA-binding S4 domain-containing protein [Saprospirales bacterium]MBK6904295.1 RNA-binding S4 domain-containing protein [Saprospirales bacterium]
MPNKVRIDKWLWAVRIYKSRTLATDACKEGKVKTGGMSAKASHMVGVGDLLEVKKNGFDFRFKVVSLLEKRVGAAIAITCYEDLTPAEELTKYKDWFVGKSTGEFRERGIGRPTKRERREIDLFKEERFEE